MATPISRRVFVGLVADRLAGIATSAAPVTIYPAGEVPGKPDVITVDGVPDPSGRVAAYVVLTGGAGGPDLEADLARTATELDWSFQTTLVAGHLDTVLRLVDRVHDRLHGWVPVLAGHSFGRVVPPPGFDPGTVQLDRTVTPHRPFVPLLWRMPVTTS